jgi:EAL domain-containing protein (putative c-di-GMP-specific phosphodiesterase class I)
MDARMQIRRKLELDLRKAVAFGEFELFYQPSIDVQANKLTGLEALIRWRHPERGLVPPAEFIPLAEENGLIVELGRWILETACRQTKLWQDETGRSDLSISVNLSGRQISDPDLVSDVARALATSSLDPACLTLEITETSLVRDVEATVAAFRALKSLGIRLAIDDFGTGYSSLSYLRQFPIDTLKIDRSFVAALDEGVESSALVRSILDLSETLRLETVAEGIETDEQRRALESLGATHGQGFLFARPMAPTEMAGLLALGEAPISPTASNGVGRPTAAGATRRSTTRSRTATTDRPAQHEVRS